MTRWAEAEYPGQLEAALHDFLDGRPVEDESELDFLQSWFLGERELPGGGTPLERYAKDGPDPRLRELAAAQATAKLSLWRVVESNPGESLIIEPYGGGERALVASANISHSVARWDLILGRLRRDLMELWGPCRCYTASDEPAIQATLARAAARHGLDAKDIDAIVRRSPAEFVNYEGLSERRLDWAIGVIEDLLPRAKLIDVTTKDVTDAIAERHERPARSRAPREIPPEAIAEVRALLTERWLSEPVPALDGLTPRQAAASPNSIPQLRTLLRTLESHAARAPDDLTMDLDAITRELGVTA